MGFAPIQDWNRSPGVQLTKIGGVLKLIKAPSLGVLLRNHARQSGPASGGHWYLTSVLHSIMRTRTPADTHQTDETPFLNAEDR